MSGKAPPTGPRALLGKQGQQGQQGQGQPGHPSHSNSRQPSSSTNISSSSSSLPSSSSSNVNTRIGAPPPTGPRSLSVNGPTRGGKAKVHVNGHSAGRERERERANSDSPSENASSSILTPRRFAISIPTKKPETNVLPKSSIQLRGKAFQDQTPKTPPQPTYDPPPPPPPAAPPPPAPPTNSPPPPPPPTNSPPPPPPPSNSPPPPPPPPKNSPPPSPPMPPPLAAPTGPKVLSATSNLPSKTLPTHNTISIALPATRPATSAAVPTQAQIQMQPPQPQPQPPPSRPHSPPKSPKYSLPPPLAWPPQKDQLPSDVRPHRVIFDSNVALLPAHELVSKDKDSREKEREARLAKDRALERAAFVSGYVKPGVKSQKPPPPNSFGTHPDLDTMMDIDFTKGEGTSTGAGTLAGSSMMGYNGYASLGRKTKEKGPGSEYFEVLAAAIKRAQTQSSSSDSCLRIQGKGKGKESITRYEGQVLAGGEWVWVPEEDVEASISAMSPITPLASSSSTSIPSSVSSSASAFLAKFHSSNEASPIPVVVNGNEHGDEARGYWVCEKIPMPRDPRRMIVRDRDKLVSNEDIGGGTHSDGVDKEAQELWLKDREKKIRSQFYMLEQYEYDPLTSTSPPPPCKVIITNIALLTPTNVLRAHFSQYGTLMSFEPQIDKQNGSSLGILCIRYPTHAEAKRCVEKENGQKRPWAGAGYGPNGVGGYHDHALNGSGNWNAKGDAGDQIQVDFDGSGQKLAAVLKELEDRKNGRKRVDSAPRPNASPLITNDSNTPNHGSGNSALRTSDHRTPTQTPTPAFKLPSSLPPRPSNLPLPPQSHSVSGSYSPAPSLPPPPASYQRSAPTPLHPSLPMRPMLDTRDSRERDRDRDRDRDRERDRDRDRLVLATPASSSTGSSSVHGGSTPRPNGTTPGSTAPLPSTSSSSTLPTNPNIPLKPSGITIATSMKAKPPPALMQARAHMKRNALLKRPEGEEDSALGSSLGTGNGTPVQIRLEKENATKENERNRARLDRGREVSRDRDRDWDRRRSRDRYGDRASLSYRRDDRDREQGRRIRSPSPGYRGRSPSRERYGSSSWRDSNRSFRRDRDRSDRNRSLSPYDDGRTYIPSHMRHSGFNAGYSRSHHYNSHRHDRSSPPPYLNSRREHDRFPRRSPRTSSRSPSSVRPVRPVGWEKDHAEVLEELGKSNFPYLRLEPDAGGQFPRQVQDEDVKSLLASFAIDKV
ncbi:hypothetical protein F5880DRAFT_558623 [Lentinula raphanica]|nr:hypothetical protein F5880DRAFT_558623 [Lentinula raphanica]